MKFSKHYEIIRACLDYESILFRIDERLRDLWDFEENKMLFTNEIVPEENFELKGSDVALLMWLMVGVNHIAQVTSMLPSHTVEALYRKEKRERKIPPRLEWGKEIRVASETGCEP